MKEVAWIGKSIDFYRQFHTQKGVFYDSDTDTTYYRISTPRDIFGRRFDEALCCWFYPDNMNKLYDEIIHTRMKKSGN